MGATMGATTTGSRRGSVCGGSRRGSAHPGTAGTRQFGILGNALAESISSKGAVRNVQPVMYQRRANDPPVEKLQKTFERSRKSYW